MAVVLACHLFALLDDFSQCRCTKVEYELDLTMHTNWDPAVVLMTCRKVAVFAFFYGTIQNLHGT